MQLFVPGDLDLWPWHSNFNCPSEGRNISSMWIWPRFIQRFPKYFIHEQKSHRQRQKQNLTQFTACGNFFAAPYT